MPTIPQPTRIPGMRRDIVAARDGTPLAVQIIDDVPGASRPTLLLVNGIGGTIITWAHLVRRFRHAFRIVGFDTRGMHGSGRPVGGTAALQVPVHADDVIAVADAVGADTFHLLGWSMGVQVAVEASIQLHRRGEGARLSSLILHNGTAGRAFEAFLGRPRLSLLIDPVLRGLQRRDDLLAGAIARVVHRPVLVAAMVRAGLVHPSVDRALFSEAAAGFADLDTAIFLDILRALGRHDAWPLLHHLTTPTVVVAGSRDMLTPLTTMQRLAQRLPNARLEVIEGGSHYAAIEMVDPFHAALTRFWTEVGALEGDAPTES